MMPASVAEKLARYADRSVPGEFHNLPVNEWEAFGNLCDEWAGHEGFDSGYDFMDYLVAEARVRKADRELRDAREALRKLLPKAARS